MALFYHPISVSAAVLSILAVIASPALAQRPPAQGHFFGDRCEGYNGVEGRCLQIYTCPTLQQDVNMLPIPEFLKRHGPPCDYDLEGNKLLCCPNNSTEPDLCQGYNGVEGTCQSYLSCASLQLDAETLTLNTFIERHAIGCNSDRASDRLICCPKLDLCQGYNGVEGTCQSYLSCASLQQDAKTLTFNTFFERHTIGCNSDRASDGLICCPKPACRSDQWDCGDGSCIPDARICDGRQDCRNNSDESNCPAACAVGEWTCHDGSCIAGSARCDNVPQCLDRSDEENCPPKACSVDEFTCTDRACIQSYLSCDGRPDCPDRSDEIGCPPDCAANEFTCRDGSCISNSEICNGLVDCRDSSDEEGCPPQDCKYDGSVYQHGEDDGCYYKCYNGTMKMMNFNPPTGNQCVGSFEVFEGNCYYFNHTWVTWCDARKICQQHGGNLAVDNFNTLKNFYNVKKPRSGAWIGVRDNLWLNGQPPQQQQWMSGDPDAQDWCGYMYTDGLGDHPCHYTNHFICQLY